MSYVIRNCPALQQTYYCDTHHSKCQDCTDCVIKQVIEKCKGAISNYGNLEILRTACETSEAYGKANISEQILQLFDIEEISE